MRTLLTLLALLCSTTSLAAQPTRLVQSGDLVYQGSFTIPDMQDATAHWTGERLPCAYVNGVIAFNPSRHSLFIVCHDWSQTVAEIGIPALGGRASVLQAPRSVANLSTINPSSPNEKQIGGLQVVGDRLIVSAFDMYDGEGSSRVSHFVRSVDFTVTAAAPVRVGNVGFTAGYMAPVPAEWRAALGGDLLTGACCMSVIGRTSFGPAVSAISASGLLAGPSSLSATQLVGYPEAHPELGDLTPTTQYYGASTQVKGVVLPVGTASVLFVGPHGTGAYCYGGGVPRNPGSGQCLDPDKSDHGTHNYPYEARVWAYDVRDLAAVKAGQRAMWTVRPYAMWALPQIEHYMVGGMAVDPETGRIFVSEKYGDGMKPRIHVYTVRDGGTAPAPDPTPDPTPEPEPEPDPEPEPTPDPPQTGLPSDAVRCATEDETCRWTGGDTRTVYYGANGVFTARAARTSPVGCNNGVFGDPIAGVLKACYTVPTTVTPTPDPTPVDPCVAAPLTITRVTWPSASAGSRQLRYTSSHPLVSVTVTLSPARALVATDTRGCAVTVR